MLPVASLATLESIRLLRILDLQQQSQNTAASTTHKENGGNIFFVGMIGINDIRLKDPWQQQIHQDPKNLIH